MSLTDAISVATNSLHINSIETSLVAKNIANSNNDNYQLKKAIIVDNSNLDGYNVVITNITDNYVSNQVYNANSSFQKSTIQNQYISQINNIFGEMTQANSTVSNDYSLSTLISNVQNSIVAAANDPTNSSLLQGISISANKLCSTINKAADLCDNLSVNAQKSAQQICDTINIDLKNLSDINKEIVLSHHTNRDATDLEDKQSSILSDLSQYINFNQKTDDNGNLKLFTGDGIPLLDIVPSVLTMKETGKNLYLSINNITASNSIVSNLSGKMGAYVSLATKIIPDFKSELDQLSQGLITAFEEAPQNTNSTTTCAGLFTNGSTNILPQANMITNLSNSICINPILNSSSDSFKYIVQGGFNGSDYVVADTSTANLTNLLISKSQSFDTQINNVKSLKQTALDTNVNLGNLLSSSSDELSKSQLDLTNYQSMLKNISGVNLDSEMSRMLDLEHSYQASAKLISILSELYKTLFQAIN